MPYGLLQQIDAMLILELSENGPLIRDESSNRVVAKSGIEFFQFLKRSSELSAPEAQWCGMCMVYLIGLECMILEQAISNAALSKRGDAVSFPFTNAALLRAFHDGMKIGEDFLLEERKDGEQHALNLLAIQLADK